MGGFTAFKLKGLIFNFYRKGNPVMSNMNTIPVLQDSLTNYMAEISRVPLLSKDDEFKLARLFKDEGDLNAAHALICANLRFVVKIASEYTKYGVGLKDLVQEGNIGLMTALKKFDVDKGLRFITYAVHWVRHFMQEYIIKTKGLVRQNFRAMKKRLFYKGHNEDTAKANALPDVSLDAPIGNDESSSTLTRLDMLESTYIGQEEIVANSEETALVKSSVGTALAVLNDRENYIVKSRIMSEEPKSLQVIGDELGVSRERVRQIEANALKKLKGQFLLRA